MGVYSCLSHQEVSLLLFQVGPQTLEGGLGLKNFLTSGQDSFSYFVLFLIITFRFL